MADRSTIYMPLAAIVPAVRNAKKHAATGIAGSISRFGLADAPVLDERTGRLVAGHGRVEDLTARKAAGHAPPDGVNVDETGEWLVPVQRGWASRDDVEADAAGVALNALTEAGGWDDQVLAQILDDARSATEPIDPASLGFDEEAFAALMDKVKVAPDPTSDPVPDERIPAGPQIPVTQTGDVWELGPHRLVCGDSFDAENVALLVGDTHHPAMVMTDPPFAIYGSASGVSSSVADDKMVRPFFEQLGRTINGLIPWFAHVYVCCDWRSYATLWDGFKRAELTPKNCLVWDKGSFGLGANWPNTHEFIAYFSKMPPQKTMTADRPSGQRQVNTKANILRFPRVTGDEREHNAAKPVDLLRSIIEVACDPGDVVLDLFGGSGSTLIAAEKSGRRAAMMEMEPAWCDVICARYQRTTGIVPVRAGVPVPFTPTDG